MRWHCNPRPAPPHTARCFQFEKGIIFASARPAAPTRRLPGQTATSGLQAASGSGAPKWPRAARGVKVCGRGINKTNRRPQSDSRRAIFSTVFCFASRGPRASITCRAAPRGRITLRGSGKTNVSRCGGDLSCVVLTEARRTWHRHSQLPAPARAALASIQRSRRGGASRGPFQHKSGNGSKEWRRIEVPLDLFDQKRGRK